MRIILLRHAKPETYEGHCYGQTDLPLCELGRRQVDYLRAIWDRPIDKIISSDLIRARHTATAVEPYCHGPSLVDPGFREMDFGEWDDSSWDKINELHPDNQKRWHSEWLSFQPPGGENYTDMAQRVIPTFDKHVTDPTLDETWVIAAHMGPIRLLMCHLLGAPLSSSFNFYTDYGTWCEFEWRRDRWIMETMGSGAYPSVDTDDVSSTARPCYAAIFHSQRNGQDDEGYQAMACAMEARAATMPGFISVDSARNEDGSGITISYWESLSAIKAWRSDVEHQKAIAKHNDWYDNYTLRIAQVRR